MYIVLIYGVLIYVALMYGVFDMYGVDIWCRYGPPALGGGPNLLLKVGLYLPS